MDSKPLSLELVPLADEPAAADAAAVPDAAAASASGSALSLVDIPAAAPEPTLDAPAPTAAPGTPVAPAPQAAAAPPPAARSATTATPRTAAASGFTVEEDTSRPIVGAMPPLPDNLPPSQDPHFANAVSEYRNGVVDKMLWQKALAQHGGDAEAAVAGYLRNRAIALKMLRRDGAASAARAPQGPARSPVRPASQKGVSEVLFTPPPAPKGPNRIPLYGGIAAGVLAIAGAAWYFLGGSETPDSSLNAAVRVKARAAQVAAAPELVDAKPKVDPAAVVALRDKVAGLKAQRNWNVFTLYASEWTRLEPNNPVAWNQLSLGYQALHQWEDAIDAAQKAATIAGTDGALWRDVGTIQLQQNRYEVARQAFDKAAAINGSDTLSLVRMGAIDVAYGRYNDAKTVLDRALLANPVDLNALCLKGLIAKRQAAPPDILAASRRQVIVDESCIGAMEPYDALATSAPAVASVAVPVPAPAVPTQAAAVAPPAAPR